MLKHKPSSFAGTGICRRTFISSATAVVTGWDALAAEAEDPFGKRRRLPIGSDLLEHVHPSVRYTRVELPEEANAFGLLRNACKHFKPFDEVVEGAVAANGPNDFDRQEPFYNALDDALREGGKFPTGRRGQVLQDWLKVNRPAMKLVRAGLDRGRLQFPEKLLLDFLETVGEADDPITMYRQFARLMRLQAKLSVSQGDYQAGAEELVHIWQLGKMVLDAEGLLVLCVIGSALMNTGNKAVRELARDGCCPPAVVRYLKRELATYRPSAREFAEAMRVEFRYFTIPEIDRLPEEGPLEDLVDTLIKRDVLLGQDEPIELFVTKGEIAELRKGLLTLLEGHPAPFDKADTVRLYSREVATLLADLHNPYAKRDRHIGRETAKEIESWPKELSFDSQFLFAGDSQRGKPISRQEIRRARAALLDVRNPVGKQLFRDSQGWRSIVPTRQVEAAATEVVLAARLYIDKHGRAPASLKALVDKGLLASVPTDPFAGKPLSHSRQEGIIWSYGHDEKDDGGDWDGDAEFPTGEDLVWKLPAIE